MPQLDFFIVSYESIFIVFFMIGYFFFLKNILSIISFELKLKNKLEIYFLNWINNYSHLLLESEPALLYLLITFIKLINVNTFIITPNKIFFGIYKTDLLLLSCKYKFK